MGIADPPNEVPESDSGESDTESEAHCQEFISSIDNPEDREFFQQMVGPVPSRILADVFHEIDKVCRTISRKHTLRRHFARAFSDTMLVSDLGDKTAVEAVLAAKGLTWDQTRGKSPAWFWRRQSAVSPVFHYSVMTRDKKLMADIEWETPPVISAHRVVQDTSPLSFTPTHEQFGITEIPLVLRAKNDFLGSVHDSAQSEVSSVYPDHLHLSNLRAKRDNIYAYLAHAQKTKFAVTPVHTQKEFDLYSTAMSPGGDFFSMQAKQNFDEMATWWSSQANGKTIF
ncbi:hypothetical protein B0H17DRAFT_1145018 [Mycena rosella]|uniref:Uncharacterized protein n=1 Tax=Mycena rosella TaxID=1033263 RepID=A0AAD7CUZ4_MYCRO|nr:hypothetical protein B0H17DRAFT_1145018 [Mycena rosella]